MANNATTHEFHDQLDERYLSEEDEERSGRFAAAAFATLRQRATRDLPGLTGQPFGACLVAITEWRETLEYTTPRGKPTTDPTKAGAVWACLYVTTTFA